MKKKKIIISVAAIAVIAVLAAAFYIIRNKTDYAEKVDDKKAEAAYQLLNDSLSSKSVKYTDLYEEHREAGTGEAKSYPENGINEENYPGKYVSLKYNESAEYIINAEKEGVYNIYLDYKPTGNSLSDFIASMEINGEVQFSEMDNIAFPLYWKDSTKSYPEDRYGDQVAPEQIRIEEWRNLPLYNYTYVSALPLEFKLKKGINTIIIKNASSDGLALGEMTIKAPEQNIMNYEDYKNNYNGDLVNGLYKVNSNDYLYKNSSQAIYSAINNPALSPQNSKRKLINTLSWTMPGTEVTYEFEAPAEGFYHLALHYQNKKEEMAVFDSIRIDGKVPFEELLNYAFPSTSGKWANEVLSDKNGTPYEIYLTKGKHTITIRSEQDPISVIERYSKLISEHVTQFELEITKITGSTNDKNRTWKMTKYIPQIADYLDAYETLIHYIQYHLQDYTERGIKSAIMSDLSKSLALIHKMQKYPNEISLYRDDLTGNDNSVLKAMGNFSSMLSEQDFSLDMIYFYGDKKLPKPNSNLIKALANNLKTVGNTFVSSKYSTKNEEDCLNIWVNRAVTHTDLMQKMADTEFTAKTGIKVKVSVMTDVNKLTLAASSGKTPDIALGLGSYVPFDLASRGALYDLTNFDDFWKVAGRSVPGAYVSYVFNEGVYAVPETLNFNTLIYRTDIFDKLKLTPPDTWQEVINMLPTLQRYGMNFYHNISSGVGYKWFYQTSPLIYQNNGKFYTEDGMHTAIDQPDAVKGIQELGDLFIAYSLDTQVGSFFNSFRYGVLPVGIVTLDDYLLIKNGAPELEGQWKLAPLPGTVQEDGSISRWFISNGMGGIIFKNSKQKEDAWEFLKWWTDYKTQVDYTYTLQSTYGKQFVWLSSNLEALKDSPIEQQDKNVIVDQVQWLRDVPRTPGQYLLERSISDIWNTMVFDGTSAQVAVDEKVIAINREIRRKMMEIGYCDSQGNLLKPYVIRDVDWITEHIEQAEREGK